jgi:hypothetical protein
MIIKAAPIAIPALAPALKPPASPAAGGPETAAELWAVGLEAGVPKSSSVLEVNDAGEACEINADGTVVGDDMLELIDKEVLEVEIAAVLLPMRLVAFNVPHWSRILVVHSSCPASLLGLSPMQSAYDCSQMK